MVLSILTKPKQDSTMENKVDIVTAPFRYFKVATSMQDSVLLPRRKWHEECWQLPSDSLQWSRWPNVSSCESGGENPTLHSQYPRVDNVLNITERDRERQTESDRQRVTDRERQTESDRQSATDRE